MPRRDILAVLLFLIGIGLALPAHAQSLPSTSDLFDISQGAQVIKSTPIKSGYSPTNMLGTESAFGTPFRDVTDFVGDPNPDYIHSIDWHTATPIALEKVAIFAQHDPVTNQRAFSRMTLFVREPSGAFREFLTIEPALPYEGGAGGNELVHEADIADVSGQHFRAEMTQAVSGPFLPGPRITEIDGFGQALPPIVVPENPVTDDLFDISQGTQVISHSAIDQNSDVQDMFGGQFSPLSSERGNTIFAGNLPKDTIHWIEWQTPEPITLERFDLFAYHDTHKPASCTACVWKDFRDAQYFGFSMFRLFAKDPQGQWEQIHEYTATNLYVTDDGRPVSKTNRLALHSSAVEPTRAREFRAEFTQYGDPPDIHPHQNMTGPRIVEIDGFGSTAPPEPDPIVIVPGITASLNVGTIFADETSDPLSWSFAPRARPFYQALIDRLAEQGFVENQNLFIAHYDWRNPAAAAATNYLKPIVDHAKQTADASKVDIIAHSMGGLVSRAYIQGPDYQDDVDQLITLGTPHLGAADAYVAWEGGEFPERWGRGLRFYLRAVEAALVTKHAAPLPRPLSFRTFFPSLEDLIPIEQFVERNDAPLPINDMAEQNEFLQTLQASIASLALVTTTTFAGTDLDTLGSISVDGERSAIDILLSRWRDGHPDPEPIPVDTVVGDLTVLLSSAHIGTDNTTISGARHDKLPEETQEEVLEALGLDNTGDHIAIATPESYMGTVILSPAYAKITGPDGSQFTCDTTKQEGDFACVVDETDPNGPKLLVIADPEPGDYEITLTGTDTGEYTAITCFSDENEDTCTQREGTTEPGKQETFSLEVTEDSFIPPVEDVGDLLCQMKDHSERQLIGPAVSLCAHAQKWQSEVEKRGYDAKQTQHWYGQVKQSFERFSSELDRQIELGNLDKTAAQYLLDLKAKINSTLSN